MNKSEFRKHLCMVKSARDESRCTAGIPAVHQSLTMSVYLFVNQCSHSTGNLGSFLIQLCDHN